MWQKPLQNSIQNCTIHSEENMKNKFACFSLLIIGLLNSLVLTANAQKAVYPENKSIQTTQTQDNSLQNYIKISSLPMNQRSKTFSVLTAEEKVTVFKLHLALQLVKRPNLTKDQKDIILESISSLSSDNYDKTKDRTNAEAVTRNIEARATSIFSQGEAFEIFERLGGNEEDIDFFQRYQNLVAIESLADRKNFVRQSSAISKSNYWKAQMVNSLASYELNKSQQNFILEVIPLLTSDAFALNDETKTSARITLNSLEKKAFELFSSEKVFMFFMNLGKEKSCGDITTAIKRKLPDASLKVSASKVTMEDACTCATTCSLDGSSTCTACGCSQTADGCGFFGGSKCTGYCKSKWEAEPVCGPVSIN